MKWEEKWKSTCQLSEQNFYSRAEQWTIGHVINFKVGLFDLFFSCERQATCDLWIRNVSHKQWRRKRPSLRYNVHCCLFHNILQKLLSNVYRSPVAYRACKLTEDFAKAKQLNMFSHWIRILYIYTYMHVCMQSRVEYVTEIFMYFSNKYYKTSFFQDIQH